MAFQAPRIIGGGQIITPKAQGNPFKGITDEINIARDRELKEKALKLEALNIYGSKDYDLKRGSSPEFEDFYSQLSDEGPSFLDLAKEKIGYGEGQWAPGKFIGKRYRSVADYFAKNPQASAPDSANTFISAYNDFQDNPNDEGKIRELQKWLFPGNPEKVDGIMGKDTKAAMIAAGLIKGKQQGGYSYGNEPSGYSLEGGGDVPGNDTGDNNPAMLEDGEYVLNRNAVKNIGKGYLDYINNEKYPRFQRGGQYDEGFEGQDVVGGRAQVVVPEAMDNSQAFNFGGGGGEDKMAMAQMAMKLFGGQSGGYVPGYQFGGGFSAPGVTGSGGQIIRPEVMDNSQAFNFGGGGTGSDPTMDYGSLKGSGMNAGEYDSLVTQRQNQFAQDNPGWDDDEWQSGGHVPKYQQGGTIRRPTGYQTGALVGDAPLDPNWSSGRQTRESGVQSEELQRALNRKYEEERQKQNRDDAAVIKAIESHQENLLAYEEDRAMREAHNLKAPGALQNFSRILSNLVSSEENQIPKFQRKEMINWETGEPIKWMYGEQDPGAPKMPGLLDIVSDPTYQTQQLYSGSPGGRELSDMPLKSIGETRADPADVLSGLSPEQLKALWKKQLAQEDDDYSYEEYLNKWFPEQ